MARSNWRDRWSHFATTSAFTKLSFSKSKLLPDGGVKIVRICHLASQRNSEPRCFHFFSSLEKPIRRLGFA